MRIMMGLLASIVMLGVTVVTAMAQDRTEADYCAASCHFYPGSVVMPFTGDTWLMSDHAWSNHGYNSNTYCAKCHSPFEADPAATYPTSQPVPPEEWQGVTCGVCHPPHDLREQWGTPIGNFDIETQEWFPVYEENADDLCTHCHQGTRHGPEPEYQGFSTAMHKKDVSCMDCHLAKVPNPLDPGRMTRSHTFHVTDNLPYSCGTVEGGCHDNKTTAWALKQINKGKMHGKEPPGQQ